MKQLLIAFCFLPVAAFAQKKVVTHTVAPKESIYSIARQYNITPKELAAFNNIDINSGLKIGQEIKVPATGGASVSPAAAAPANNGSPVYHTVGKKETLYGISQKYGKVPVDNIKKWNHLSSDALQEGQVLIVGYGAAENKVAAQKPANTVTPASTENGDLARQKAELAAKQRELEEQERRLKAEEERQRQAAAKAESDKRKADDQATINEIQQKRTAATAATTTAPAGKFGGGYFKGQFSPTKNVEEKGLAGVFKSTSGWEDGKYYCLHNNAPIGSVIRITNPASGAQVYAKVLDVIPDLKQNQAVVVRLSNSAAAELGQGDANFECTISY